MIFPILHEADETSAEIHIMSFPQQSQTSNYAAICVPSSSTTMQGQLAIPSEGWGISSRNSGGSFDHQKCTNVPSGHLK